MCEKCGAELKKGSTAIRAHGATYCCAKCAVNSEGCAVASMNATYVTIP
jgi:hypothetical protein